MIARTYSTMPLACTHPWHTQGDKSLPRTFLWRPEDLAVLREGAQAGHHSGKWARMHHRTKMWLRRNVADTIDQNKLYSVIDQKAVPLSGDKHDYQSVGFYWWPCTMGEQV